MLSLSQPHHYYQVFLSQSIGAGIGMGLMFLPSVSVPAHYFRKRRSLAMGVVIAGPPLCLYFSSALIIFSSGSSLGGCVYPIMLNNIIERAGFQWAVRYALVENSDYSVYL